MPTTSSLGSATAVEGLLLQVGASVASPGAYQTIANVSDYTQPLKADTVDVTNVGDTWHRRISTLLDMGAITFNVFWMMLETTHDATTGLRYFFENRILKPWKVVYPDGSSSSDTFDAYVTAFSSAAKVGDVFRASCTLSNDGAPSLV